MNGLCPTHVDIIDKGSPSFLIFVVEMNSSTKRAMIAQNTEVKVYRAKSLIDIYPSLAGELGHRSMFCTMM